MNKHFVIGFFSGFLLFLVINLLAAHLASDCGLLAVFRLDLCADDIARAGWPLLFYEEGGFVFRLKFIPLYLIVDSWVGIILALVTGWLFSHNKKTLAK